MLGTDIRMDLLIQYGMQAASGLLILGIGAFLAKSAGRYTHKALGKFRWSHWFDSFLFGL